MVKMVELLRSSILLLVISVVLKVAGLAIDKQIEDAEHFRETQPSNTAFDQIIRENKPFNDEAEKANNTALFEADINLSGEPEGENGPDSSIESKLMKRALRRAQEYLWVTRIVPYEISPELADSTDLIISAMEKIEQSSCVSFIHRTNQKQWVTFVDRGQCSSSVGRSFWAAGVGQDISLGRGCLVTGIIIHEILHALGFWHEQSRPDRDNYVEILWENIDPNQQYNFAKYSKGVANDKISNYDFNSVMHYGTHAFSKNGEPTIIAINHNTNDMGQRNHLSAEDKIKLDRLYKCEDVGKTYTEWSTWSPCDTSCKKTRQRFCSSYDSTRCPEMGQFGVHSQDQQCSHVECYEPINGHWNRWSSWSDCSADCGAGKRIRTRVCDDPTPKNGGINCVGGDREQDICFIVPCGFHPDDCLFDNQRTCYWTDDSKSDFKWERTDGRTPSGHTGPSSDHTTKDKNKNGFYMYTEASGFPAGAKASLVSKAFNKVANRCMTFFYSMHGSTMGALRVFIVTQGSGDAEKKLWEKSGPQGQDWQEAQVDISSKYAYRIRFEAERGVNYQSDIGLDDIHFRDTACSVTTPQVTAPPIKMPAPLDPISNVCGVKIKPIGCFADQQQSAFEEVLDSHRQGDSKYHGIAIDWKDYKTTLSSLLCDCITRARKLNMKYIGMQNYGQCYGSKAADYNKYGGSQQCVDKKYEACTKPNTQDVCMGKEDTNYVYEIL